MSKRSRESIIESAIKRGKNNQETLDALRKHYPASRTTLATINYFRNNLRKVFPHVKSDRELKR